MLALFVRVVSPDAATARLPLHLECSPEDLRIVRRQHRVFYALLCAAPIEWLWRGRPAGWLQLGGALVFLAGVLGYRRAGGALGAQLSPLVAPREPAVLVADGPYRWLRHPMYLAELAMAFGATGTLAAPIASGLAALFTVVIVRRIAHEERALAARLPEYRRYAARTHRLVPYVY